ncbi:MAG TPA: alpha/beta hydrolase [Porticoccaceae bacterium]|nr:alpha/beta hydrolase [Porticoccaceae bacterium]
MEIRYRGELAIRSRGLSLAAKEWGSPDSRPVIALHGWLDNAATFDRMLPSMSDLHVVALDAAGHGLSDFRSDDASYDIWLDVADVIAVADHMGWDRFTLLGHSRGAIVAVLVAGSFPDRVSHLAMIDGHVPIPATEHNAARQIAKAIRDHRRFGNASPSFFSSFERAVHARSNGFLALQLDAAEILAQRGVRQSERGFYWHNDQRLKGTSSIKFTREQLQSFLAAVSAPTLLIQAQQSIFTRDDKEAELFASIIGLQIVDMAGGHHLHLESQHARVAQEISRFLSQHE